MTDFSRSLIEFPRRLSCILPWGSLVFSKLKVSALVATMGCAKAPPIVPQ
jgi:hypothetical protein